MRSKRNYFDKLSWILLKYPKAHSTSLYKKSTGVLMDHQVGNKSMLKHENRRKRLTGWVAISHILNFTFTLPLII